MKKSIFLVLLAVTSLVRAQETGVVFLHDTVLSTALAQAEKQGKLLFVDCYSTWCGPCMHLSKNVFPLKEVGDFYNRNFVCAKFDMDKFASVEIAQKYGVRGFPTLLFLNGKGEMVHKSVGAGDANMMIELGKTAMDSTKNLVSVERKIMKGDHSAETISLYLGLNRESPIKDSLLNVYFSSIPEEEKFSKASWGLLFNYIDNLDDKNFQFFLSNRAKFAEKISKPATEQLLKRAFGRYMYNHRNDSDNFQKLKEIDLEIFETCQMQKENNKAIGDFLGNKTSKAAWDQMINVAQKYLKSESIHPMELNQMSWMVWGDFKTFNDTSALRIAKSWSKRSVDQMPDNDAINDTYGHILFDLGEVEEAIKYEEIAMNKGKEANSPYLNFYIDEVARFKKSVVK